MRRKHTITTCLTPFVTVLLMNVPGNHFSGTTGIIMVHTPSMTATGAVVKSRKSYGTFYIIASSCIYQKNHGWCDVMQLLSVSLLRIVVVVALPVLVLSHLSVVFARSMSPWRVWNWSWMEVIPVFESFIFISWFMTMTSMSIAGRTFRQQHFVDLLVFNVWHNTQ